MTISTSLGAFAAGLTLDAIPAGIRAQVKALLLFNLSVAIAAAHAALPRQALSATGGADALSANNALRFLDGAMVAAESAAFANGVLMHFRMQDDAHPAGHLGTAIIPAALAIAETVDADGTALLTALTAGYEAGLRVGRDHAKSLSSRGFRTTPIYGTIAAGVAVAKLLGLDATSTGHALALAANFGGGMRHFQEGGTEEYALQAGSAARSGIFAARMAAAGIPASPATLEGKAGFFGAFGAVTPELVARATQDLGSQYEIDIVTYKPQPGGQFHRGIVLGMADLRAAHKGKTPKAIRIWVSPFVSRFPGLRSWAPFRTFSQAFYSIPFIAALAWVDGAISFKGLHRFEDADILSAVAGVEILEDEARDNYSPRLEIDFTDGSSDAWDAGGGEDVYRIAWAPAVDMAHRLLGEVGIGEATCAALIQAVDTIETAPVRDLNRLVHQAIAESLR
jgi:2-methylcitrate dehydratase PrpD